MEVDMRFGWLRAFAEEISKYKSVFMRKRRSDGTDVAPRQQTNIKCI
jgi:hypothetical protein